MMTRCFLALTLCPGIGILTGGWLSQQATPLARAARASDSTSHDAVVIVMDLLYGAGAGCAIGIVFGLMLIWCARCGRRSAQRALADLLIIALGVLFIADWLTYLGLVPNAAELWPKLLAVNAGVWLVGLVLAALAVRKTLRGSRSAGAEA